MQGLKPSKNTKGGKKNTVKCKVPFIYYFHDENIDFFVNCTDRFLMCSPHPKPQTEAKRPENSPKICELSPCLNKGQKEGGKRPAHPVSPPYSAPAGTEG